MANTKEVDFQDGAEHGSRVVSSEKTLQLFVFYLLFFSVTSWMLLV